MGFNNGYDSGYCDAKAELGAEIEELKKKLAEGGSGSKGLEPVDVAVPAGNVVPLRNNTLSKVSVNLVTKVLGGWSDQNTSRPPPTYQNIYDDEYQWVFPSAGTNDYYPDNDPFFHDGGDGNDWYYMGAVPLSEGPDASPVEFACDLGRSVLLNATVTAASPEKETITATVDGGSTPITLIVEPSYSEEDEYRHVYSDSAIVPGNDEPHHVEGSIHGTAFPAVGSTFELWYMITTAKHLSYTSPVTISVPPDGFKLSLPETDAKNPCDVQVLLTAVGVSGVPVKDIVQAPAGKTLVYDESATTGYIQSGSGKSTLITFREATPGVVTVSTLIADAADIVPANA